MKTAILKSQFAKPNKKEQTAVCNSSHKVLNKSKIQNFVTPDTHHIHITRNRAATKNHFI